MTKRIGSDLALLLARVMVGIIFMAHGLQKWHVGMDSTTAGFTRLGVPSPQLAALFATGVELVGGAMLVIGLGVRIVALALLVDMAGAGIFVGARNGIFNSTPGWELVVALAATCLVLLALGGGLLGVDGMLNRWSATRDERIDNEESPPSPTVPTGAVIVSRVSDHPSAARPFTVERPTARYSPAAAARPAPTPGPDPVHDLPLGPVAHETVSGPDGGQEDAGAGKHAVPPQAGASEPQPEAESTELRDLRSEVDRLKGELAAARRRRGAGGQA
ncbi:DoxX family protein [Nonomuraea sp. NPDC049152]|uniref:DoxX family protein n=1 Tax=Nonomuraea sp. NPDC049152 TaxID=3154350 RepID=UPI0033C4C576